MEDLVSLVLTGKCDVVIDEDGFIAKNTKEVRRDGEQIFVVGSNDYLDKPTTTIKQNLETMKINEILVEAKGILQIESLSLLHRDLEIRVHGSGSCLFTNKQDQKDPFSFIQCIVIGSGMICRQAIQPFLKVDDICASVSGKGHICGFHAFKRAKLDVLGSGDIHITTEPTTSISEKTFGKGTIRYAQHEHLRRVDRG